MTLRWVPGWNGLTEPEAVSYVAAVEAADGQELEFGVARAINDFVVGCKNDGIWDAIKASCILAGARTLSGALVPLVGTAPTNFNFVAGDYNRETGLVGDGSTKYLNSNRNNNADPQNSKHVAVRVTTASTSATTFPCYIGAGLNATGATNLGVATGTNVIYTRLNSSSDVNVAGAGGATGTIGLSRSSSTQYIIYQGLISATLTTTSQTPFNGNLHIFQDNAPGALQASNARLAFYSIGESLDLAALDTRVSNLITAIGVAIP